MMVNLLVNTTDTFLCHRIRSVFNKTEAKFSNSFSKEKLLDELERFEENPLECTIGMRSEFQKEVKMKIKLIVGFFFVFIPLTVLSLFAYFTKVDITFAIFATLFIALFASSRLEEVAERYVHARELELKH
jgi:hypothetical protein